MFLCLLVCNTPSAVCFLCLLVWNFLGLVVSLHFGLTYQALLLEVRDWTMIMPDEVTFKNAFRARKIDYNDPDARRPLPQMFTFIPRSGLPDQGRGLTLSQRVPRGMGGPSATSADDVFCLVKESMACRSLSQDPLLVFPSSLLASSERFLSMANSAACPLRSWQLEGERWDELRAIRAAIQNDFPHMCRAVAWYQQFLCNPRPEPQFSQVPQLSFLRNASARQQDWHSFQLAGQPLAPRPHELQVVFHRASAR